MPVLANVSGGHTEFANEREILYKLFFDMKKDVTELKRLFLELIQNPELAAQHPQFLNELQNLETSNEYPAAITFSRPIVGQPASSVSATLDAHVEVEESLNILDKEKELILKALKKHKSKRKDAAADLGISERTLYRKLKEYNIEE
jgi:DNA-binding NtrC family response regulator